VYRRPLGYADNFSRIHWLRTTTKSLDALCFGHVVVRVTSTDMECSIWHSDRGSKGMKFRQAVSRQVEPVATVLRHFCVVDVYQFLSP
jgi:hypothetical protein